MGLHLSQIDQADELLTHDPLALLIGMAPDQQIPMERAFTDTVGASTPRSS